MTDDAAFYGSRRLAEALAAGDVDALGRALRMDVVLLPLLDVPGEEAQVRVFGSPDPNRPYRLFLFSSAETYQAFVGPDDPQRSFSLVPGRSIASFLDANLTRLELVAFDPGSEHPMTASPEDVRAILEPRASDDEVAWIAGGEQPALDTPPGASIDLTGLHVVDPSVAGEAEKLLEVLVGRMVHFVPAPRQPLVRAWAADVVVRTGRGVSTVLGARPIGGPMNATLVAVWPQWRAGEHLIESVGGAARGRGETVDELSGAAGTILRHEHVDGPSLLIDHWMQVGPWAFALRVATDPGTDRLAEVRALGERIATAVTFVD